MYLRLNYSSLCFCVIEGYISVPQNCNFAFLLCNKNSNFRIFLFYIAFAWGDPMTLLNPTDSQGNAQNLDLMCQDFFKFACFKVSKELLCILAQTLCLKALQYLDGDKKF